MSPATDQLTQETTYTDNNGVSGNTKLIVAVIMIAIIIGSGNPIGMLIAALIGYFLLGPLLAKNALLYHRSADWAFAIGSIFTLGGCLAYWVYTKIVGVKK